MKQVARFYMDINGKWTARSAALAGGAFFFRILYYFAFQNVMELGGWEMFSGLILPLVLSAAYFIMVRGFRLNACGLYGILGTVYCLMMMVSGYSGGILSSVLNAVYFVALALLMLATVGGYLPEKWYLAVFSLAGLLIRFLAADLDTYIVSLKLVDFLPEASALCGLGAIFCLAMCLKKGRLIQK